MYGLDQLLFILLSACFRIAAALKNIHPSDLELVTEWVHAIKKVIQEIMFLIPWIAVCWLYVREALKAVGIL